MARRSVVVALALICASMPLASGLLGCMPPGAEQEGSDGTSGDVDADDDGDADGDEASDSGDTGDGEANEDTPCVDPLEPNDAVESATALSWGEAEVSDEGLHRATTLVDARLCATEHDWYLIATSALEFAPQVLRFDVILEGSSWCGQLDGCNDPALASGPEHTVAVEIHDASSMVLLTAAIATDGRIDVDGWGDDYRKDLLVHVYSPVSAATFGYQLNVDARDDDSDVECECD